jgi:hypothetical protein
MGKKWTAELDSALITMRGAGMTHQEIGSIMGRSHQACSQRAFALGITKNRSDTLPIDLPVYETDAPADAVDAAYEQYKERIYPNGVSDIYASVQKNKPTLLERMFSKLLGGK